jgi:archaellum component FlaG (FlaF/FlaG flagellin family)
MISAYLSQRRIVSNVRGSCAVGLTLLTAAIGALAIAGCASPLADDGSSPSTPSPTVTISQSARVGGLEFTVTKVARRSSIGSAPGARFQDHRAKGVYQIIWYALMNVGEEPKGFDEMHQRLFIDGREYVPELMTSDDVDGQSEGSDTLSPGHGASAVVVFDIPTGSPMGEVVLQSSDPSSDQVRVDLSSANNTGN